MTTVQEMYETLQSKHRKRGFETTDEEQIVASKYSHIAIVELDDDCIGEILLRCDPAQLLVCKQVSKLWYEMAHSCWNAYRERALVLLYGRSGVKQNWPQGAAMMGKLAEAGDDYAMMMYGFCLNRGIGVKEDKKRGRELIQRSTHVCARAYCLQWGWGVAQDQKQALQLLLNAPDQSDPHLMYMLGHAYHYAWGCKADHPNALHYFQRADSHVGAVYMIGLMYEDGYGVPQDDVRATQCYQTAADQGHADSIYILSCMYRYGWGVPQDITCAKVLKAVWRLSKDSV